MDDFNPARAGPKRSLLDSAIAYLAPSAAARRAVDRLRLRAAELATSTRKYEAASTTRRFSKWNPGSSSANVETKGGLTRIRDRSRDLVRNNAWAARAVRVLETHIVGRGIRPRLDPGTLKEAWMRWAGSTDCDAGGRLNLFGIQQKVVRCLIESGEVLVRRITTSDAIPLRLAVLEPDFLDDTKDEELANGGRIVQGVEFDAQGLRVAYHLYRFHPSEWRPSIATDRVPASEVLHLFREDRPGQVRGVPWGHAAFVRLREWDEYVDANLMRHKVAAALVGFERDIAVEPVAVDMSADPDGTVVDFEPGTWEKLGPGKTIEFSKPPAVEGFEEFGAAMIREIAQAWGLTYEALSGDYSRVNFTSGRMGANEFEAEIDGVQRHLVIPGFCDPAFRWFVVAASLVNAIRRGDVPTAPRWITSGRTMIDPTRELAARVSRVRAGFSTLSGELMRDGEDPDELLAERAADDAKVDKLGLVLDSDPRRIDPGEVGNPAAGQSESTQGEPAGKAKSKPGGDAKE